LVVVVVVVVVVMVIAVGTISENLRPPLPAPHVLSHPRGFFREL
jgi:hypothetical protein